MTTLTEPVSQTRSLVASRLRVVLFCDIMDGTQQRFLDAYEQLRHQVAAVPGHVSDQLCQSIEDPSQWLITSEWESAKPFLAWVDSEAHREMVKPLHGCVRDTRSLRYNIMRETAGNETFDGPAPVTDGTVRHALTFKVKPGSERAVAEILAGYSSPQARVDDHTRLLRTSLFMRGNRVVRAVEVAGDLAAALRHVAQQPEVRAVEEAINPYLEEARDLNNPESARSFFMRAALPAVHHVARPGRMAGDVTRYAVSYPVRSGCGAALADLLAGQDQQAVADPDGVIAAATLFQREDVVVRVVDLPADREHAPAAVLGVAGDRSAGLFARLVELGGHDLGDNAGIARFVTECRMDLVTDRSSKDA
ncbi:SchA/CurD-like domain-containing protein [Kitasatospora sp. MBT63]|uniref:SchA/CurD-like domain-containing protein n=1 Tax=Kitasatospora sp. MBT63 TaxID=1444768 RepID=UPI000539A91F|nr:SchA/CurD-like domain-containing protein [Kitasatospora sp. MBT63]